MLSGVSSERGDVEVHLVNSLVYGNTADREGGGVVVWAQQKARTKLVILNSTITGNISNYTAAGGGGVIVEDDENPDSTSIVQIYNSILYGNTAIYGPDLCIWVGGTHSRADCYYSNVNEIYHVKGTFNQGNNLNTDPLFVDPANGDFHLLPESPMIDAGTVDVPIPPGLSVFDFEGDPRRIDGDQDGTDLPDIGADEYIPETFTSITLLSPNGGEALPSGSTTAIRWGAPSEATRFKVLISMDNGRTWNPIAKGIHETSYPWQVPKPTKNKGKCRVKVVGFNDAGNRIGADTSAAPFTIEVVRLIWPNGGEILQSGTTWTVRWTTHKTKRLIKKVEFFYSTDGGKSWIMIKRIKGSNPGSFSWQIPSLTITKTTCKVRVQLIDEFGNILGVDQSDFDFEIRPAP